MKFPQASDETAGSMFALVAVDEDGMVASIEDCSECGCDLVGGDGDERLFVTGDAKLEEGDSVLVEER